jgi:hypothetical protein
MGIPYFQLATNVFSTKGQTFIPFLGAGVSVSAREFRPARRLTTPPPERGEIDAALGRLRLKSKGKTFLELAILLAYLIELEEAETTFESTQQFKDRLKKEPYPPFASELAELFGRTADYSTYRQLINMLRESFPEQLMTSSVEDQVAALELLSKVTRIAHPPEPLTSISSYYEKLCTRGDLWSLLMEVFESKKTPTLTHRLLAASARHHLAQPGAIDYLVITTNYDCLMENALDELQLPYVVLTTKRGNDPKVMIRCSQTVPQAADLEKKYKNKLYPVNFQMLKSSSFVVVYKIHGDIYPKMEFADEGVVISDNDYVDYVSQMGRKDGVIPAHVSELMRDKRFWFLGYSLSDWNVRSIYETLKTRSNPDGGPRNDYSVMRAVGPFEKLFFEKNQITIFEAALNDFVQGIVDESPPDVNLDPFLTRTPK